VTLNQAWIRAGHASRFRFDRVLAGCPHGLSATDCRSRQNPYRNHKHTPGSGGALQSDPQYLLTTRGDYVLSHSPLRVEISLGSKQVRRVGWHNPVEVPARISVDG
jgi:hypothetical protein